MALTATHIRYALHLKDKYQVKNIHDYTTGVMYPDSRYPTGIKRELTHPADFESWDVLSLDDFKKGWLTHLYCDQLQGEVVGQILPEFYEPDPANHSKETWVVLTAVKLLQDMDDIKKFDLQSNLPSLDYIQANNHESLQTLQNYFTVLIDFYSATTEHNIEDYKVPFMGLGMSDELADIIVGKARDMSENENVMQRIKQIYDLTLLKSP